MSKKPKTSQLDLAIEREKQVDRNFSEGGRSFYFFDFDDNIAFLKTSIYLFHKETKEEISLTSGEFARFKHLIGSRGELRDYHMIPDDPEKGSFRNFRDQSLHSEEAHQVFVKDVLEVLNLPDYLWKGPSWNCFYHAVFNERPMSIITARGHEEETIKIGISEMVNNHYLPHEPNYLSVFPVSHPQVHKSLAPELPITDVASLKKRAIKESVNEAFKEYGENEFHRFGMSDDDPKNIDLIIEAMTELKQEFPKNSFFVFDSNHGRLLKREIFQMGVVDQEVDEDEQLSLF